MRPSPPRSGQASRPRTSREVAGGRLAEMGREAFIADRVMRRVRVPAGKRLADVSSTSGRLRGDAGVGGVTPYEVPSSGRREPSTE